MASASSSRQLERAHPGPGQRGVRHLSGEADTTQQAAPWPRGLRAGSPRKPQEEPRRQMGLHHYAGGGAGTTDVLSRNAKLTEI